MKFAIVLLSSTLAAVSLCAQDTSSITVKQASRSGDVIQIAVQVDGKAMELHCTQSVLFCSAPKPGAYTMVRLPKNRGIYECSNVDLYEKSADPQNASKIGEYCLEQKQ